MNEQSHGNTDDNIQDPNSDNSNQSAQQCAAKGWPAIHGTADTTGLNKHRDGIYYYRNSDQQCDATTEK